MDSGAGEAWSQSTRSLILMTLARRPLHIFRQRFDLLRRLVDYMAGRYLAARAREHIGAGRAPVAVFAFDFIGRDIALKGQFERDDLAVLDDFLAPLRERFVSGTALDIGANIGNHSLFFADRFALVHCFEPNPLTFGVLSVNARLAPNITLHNVALGDRPAMLPLAFNSLNVGEASLVAKNESLPVSGCEVEVKRLDDLAVDLGDVSLMKLDVEGFEANVIRGALETLRDNQPVLIFEQNPDAFVSGRSEAAELLQQEGYVLCVFKKRGSGQGGLRRIAGLVQKVLLGLRYDVVPVETLQPGHYSMIVALPPADAALLARREKVST